MKQQPVQVAIKAENKLVVMKFDRDVNYVELEPQNCLDICEAMSAAAFEARDDLKPAGPALKASLVERHHDKLVPRIALMLGSMRQDKLKSDGNIAEQIVTTCLAEVF